MTAIADSSSLAVATPVGPRSQWLVSPTFDLLMVANVTWPLFLLLQFREGFDGRAGLQFWQIYFVTTPHRWITLALVFFDRERFRQQRLLFLGILGAAVLICATVRITTGALTCLLTIDYLWNAWHFAAQHQGIYGIYGRLSKAATPNWRFVERWLLRSFLLYVTFRVATATWVTDGTNPTLEIIDWLIPLAPLSLLMRDVLRIHEIAAGRLIYLISVSLLYLTLLWAVHERRPALVLSLTTASALFHALEYLAIVSWKVRKRQLGNSKPIDWMGTFAAQWLTALGTFMVVIGSGAWLLEQQWAETWLFLNVIAALLHYAFDGIIWRHRPTPRLSASL